MRGKFKGKKGQVSSTLTWFVATLVIFFIMFLFISASVFLAGKKYLPIIGEGKSKISFSEYERVTSRNVLYSFLNRETEFEGKKLKEKELVVLWALEKEDARKEQPDGKKEKMAEKIKQDFKGIFQLYREGCFYTLYSEYKSLDASILVASKEFDEGEDSELIFKTGEIAEEFFEKAESFSLLVDGKELKGKFRAEGCE